MRRPEEIIFRAHQESANLRMFVRPPSLPRGTEPATILPDVDPVVEALRGTALAPEIEALADPVLNHKIPLFGEFVETGPTIHWRRDYRHGQESGRGYFRRIPYLDFSVVGDHKLIWELNRHQHLVLLAQAYRLTGRGEFLSEVAGQLTSWFDENPFLRGVNWTSALEVAFRALSWIWVWHLAGRDLPPSLQERFLNELFRHGCFLGENLSVYFSPNTHLLGEAVALHALGRVFGSTARGSGWARKGAQVVREQMFAQVREDGSHFEQSSYYHLYSVDLFLFHRLLSEADSAYDNRLRAMAGYLAAVCGPRQLLPLIGDDDGGRMFHPYGCRAEFARATLAACAVHFDCPEWLREQGDLHPIAVWWLGAEATRYDKSDVWQRQSRFFPQAGLAVFETTSFHAIVDAGPFGFGRGGHSHADTLSLVLSGDEGEILIDPGTFTYVGDPKARNEFRGTSAHNTVRIDGSDQAVAAGPFGWSDHPRVCVHQWTEDGRFLDAECRYRGFLHRRQVFVATPQLLVIVDEVQGSAGEHVLEQFWHLGQPACRRSPTAVGIGSHAMLLFPEGTEPEIAEGRRSPVFGISEPAPVVRIARRTTLPATFVAAILVGPVAPEGDLQITCDAGGDEFRIAGQRVMIPKTSGSVFDAKS